MTVSDRRIDLCTNLFRQYLRKKTLECALCLEAGSEVGAHRASHAALCLSPPRLMAGTSQTLKVSAELLKTYAQRRNSHLVSLSRDGDHGGELDPYAFEDGDDDFSFGEKKDKAGERDASKKQNVSPAPSHCAGGNYRHRRPITHTAFIFKPLPSLR